jgi:uncharacterized protein (DUF4415 family)
MSRKSTIKRYSVEEIKGKRARGEDETRSDAPEPPELAPGFWEDAQIVLPRSKQAVSLCVDAAVLDWFKNSGPGYLARMNAVLRSYVEAMQRESSTTRTRRRR